MMDTVSAFEEFAEELCAYLILAGAGGGVKKGYSAFPAEAVFRNCAATARASSPPAAPALQAAPAAAGVPAPPRPREHSPRRSGGLGRRCRKPGRRLRATPSPLAESAASGLWEAELRVVRFAPLPARRQVLESTL